MPSPRSNKPRKGIAVAGDGTYTMPFPRWMEEENSHMRRCRDHPDYNELFFADTAIEGRSLKERRAMVRQAKALCAECPVLQNCFDLALDHIWATGIWGGTTHLERKCLKQLCAHEHHGGRPHVRTKDVA